MPPASTKPRARAGTSSTTTRRTGSDPGDTTRPRRTANGTAASSTAKRGRPAGAMHQSAEVEMADIGALIKATAKTVAKIRADAMIESASTRGRHVLKAKADAWDQLVAMVAGG